MYVVVETLFGTKVYGPYLGSELHAALDNAERMAGQNDHIYSTDNPPR